MKVEGLDLGRTSKMSYGHRGIFSKDLSHGGGPAGHLRGKSEVHTVIFTCVVLGLGLRP